MRLTVLVIAAALFAAPAMTQSGIQGTAHDFSTATWNTAKPNETCGVCHIPHVEGRAGTRTAEDLLWGRELSGVTYTLYSSTTLDGTINQPSGHARLCLGCHDGSVALELFHTVNTGTTFIDTAAQVPGLNGGTNFAADHPISITYEDGAGGDPGLRPRTDGFGTAVPGQTIEDILDGNLVQCSSCHDPHNVQVEAGAANFLRIKNDDVANPSALCTACHIK